MVKWSCRHGPIQSHRVPHSPTNTYLLLALLLARLLLGLAPVVAGLVALLQAVEALVAGLRAVLDLPIFGQVGS